MSNNNILDIIIHPNPILRKKSIKIELNEIPSPNFQKLCIDMVQTMELKDGAGLAAPQIGKNIRLIVINAKDKPLIMINPELTRKSLIKKWDSEGCLSIIDKNGNLVYGDVKRHYQVNCKFIDEFGKKRNIKAKGLMARIIQHEIDHLNGILFIDKAKNIEKLEI